MRYIVAAEPEPDARVTHKGYDLTLFRWSFKNEDEMGPALGEGEEDSGLESLTAVSRASSLHPNLRALSAKRKASIAEPDLLGRRRRNCQPHVLRRRGSSEWCDGGPVSELPSGCLPLHTPRSSLSLPAPAVLLFPHPPPSSSSHRECTEVSFLFPPGLPGPCSVLSPALQTCHTTTCFPFSSGFVSEPQAMLIKCPVEFSGNLFL